MAIADQVQGCLRQKAPQLTHIKIGTINGLVDDGILNCSIHYAAHV